MAVTKLNGKPRHRLPIPESQGDPSATPPTIPLTVAYREGFFGTGVGG